MRCNDCGNTKRFTHSFDARVTESILDGEIVEEYSFCFDDCDEAWECSECNSNDIDLETKE